MKTIGRFFKVSFIIVIILSVVGVFVYKFPIPPFETQKLTKDDCNNNWALCKIFSTNSIIESKKRVKIAILDSGIEEIEPLKGKVVDKFNTFDNTNKTKDEFGHGTQIASIIGANRNDLIVQGINPKVSFYDVKVLDKHGKGEVGNLIKGLEWAIDKKVDIVNISLNFDNYSSELHKLIKKGYDNNIIFIGSSGNEIGMETNYPAKFKEVVSISSIDRKENIDFLASQGKIDFVAPGFDVPTIDNKENLSVQQGSSFAAAYATGVISILIANDLIHDIEQYTAKLGSSEIYGKGILHLK